MMEEYICMECGKSESDATFTDWANYCDRCRIKRLPEVLEEMRRIYKPLAEFVYTPPAEEKDGS